MLELPNDKLEVSESPELFYDRKTAGAYSFFGRRTADPPRDMFEQPADGQRKGQRVRHPTLGEGVILAFDGDGDSAKITVFFDRAGKRKLVARYANLEIL